MVNYKLSQIVETKIERTQKTIAVDVVAGQPGLIFGKNNANLKTITLAINKIVGRKINISFNVVTFENIATSARLIAREIADAIEKKVSFLLAQKMAIISENNTKILNETQLDVNFLYRNMHDL